MSSSKELIAVTGANGFLGLHVVQQLIAQGHLTRAIVRSERSAEPLKRTLGDAVARGLLQLAYVPDILANDHVYDEAFTDATAVIHVASPIFEVGKPTQDPEKDFYSPAERGALHALQAASRVASIKRFVLTGSVVASYRPEGHGTLEKDYFNPITREEAVKVTDARIAYGASKKFSEKAVWSFVEREKPSFTVVVLLPGLIVGPPGDAEQTYDVGSNSIYMLWAKYPSKFLTSTTTAIDVRDCARAHVQAALFASPSYDNKRLFVVDKTVRAVNVAQLAIANAPAWAKEWGSNVEGQVEEAARTPFDSLTAEQKGYVVESAEQDARALGIYPYTDVFDTLREVLQAASA